MLSLQLNIATYNFYIFLNTTENRGYSSPFDIDIISVRS